MNATFAKADEVLGLVFGWAIVCTEDGQPYHDLHGDFIPEPVMLKAALKYVESGAAAKEMHLGGDVGRVAFVWPLTADIAAAMGIASRQTGLMIAMKPDDPAIIEKFKNGTYSGFSIGGTGERRAA